MVSFCEDPEIIQVPYNDDKSSDESDLHEFHLFCANPTSLSQKAQGCIFSKKVGAILLLKFINPKNMLKTPLGLLALELLLLILNHWRLAERMGEN